MLATLREHVLEDGGRSRTAKRAARGLEQLQVSYTALAKAEGTTDVKTKVALIKHAAEQAKAAKKNARAAGVDWPL